MALELEYPMPQWFSGCRMKDRAEPSLMGVMLPSPIRMVPAERKCPRSSGLELPAQSRSK